MRCSVAEDLTKGRLVNRQQSPLPRMACNIGWFPLPLLPQYGVGSRNLPRRGFARPDYSFVRHDVSQAPTRELVCHIRIVQKSCCTARGAEKVGPIIPCSIRAWSPACYPGWVAAEGVMAIQAFIASALLLATFGWPLRAALRY
jgi:hypothetical protein